MIEKKLTDLQRFILRQLALSAEGLSAYTLWSRFKLSMDDVVTALRPIIDKGFVKIDGARISLSHEGIAFLHSKEFGLYQRGERPWRECPPEFCQPRIGPFDPIIPVMPSVHRSLLPNRLGAPERNQYNQ
jgi:hypothetical protein